METLPEKIKNLPDKSGVYLLKNRRGEIIYVGKALSLRKRVSSYFQGRDFPPKVQALVSHIGFIDYLETDSEKEALLLEYELIKRFRPKYNVLYRDDKSYPYVKLTIQTRWPCLSMVRKIRRDGARYYGPYPDGSHWRKLLHYVRKYFPLRFCRSPELPRKACLYYHLKRCPAPCIGRVCADEYKKMVKEVDLFLKNRHSQLLLFLEREMKKHSARMEYEQAQRLQSEIVFVKELLERIRFRKVQPQQLLSRHLERLPQEQLLPRLKRELMLPKLPRRIEAFDISLLSGKHAVGSMITFIDGRPAKQFYRRFRIKTVPQPDDYAMLREVLLRRYSRVLREKLSPPALILVDGGKGQLAVAQNVIAHIGLAIPVVSIAKKEEQIFVPGSDQAIELDRRSPALQLVRHVRDEAHRFAVAYHRLLRKKNIIPKKK